MRYVYSRFDPSKYEFTLVAPKVDEVEVLSKDLSNLDVRYKLVEERPSFLQFLKTVTREILKSRYNLIHSHGTTSGICAAVGSFLKKTPHILTLHEVFHRKAVQGVDRTS